MRVIIARNSGFCNGVKRAMRIAVEAAGCHGGLQADGPLVHNAQAIELLALHGVADSSRHPDKPMLVRAHGVAPEQRRSWRERGLELVDATCVHVAANQKKAADAAARGRIVLLAGDPDHAEVLAVAASAGEGCRLVSRPEDVANLDLPDNSPVYLLAQTTFNVAAFGHMAEAACRRFADAEIADTICRATHDRQEETVRLAERVEVVVVMGGRHSANTRRLADTAAAAGKPVFLAETADELRREDFASYRIVGVTSGASTPGWITQEAVNRLRGFGWPEWLRLLTPALLLLVQMRLTTAAAAAGLALAAQYYLLEELVPALALAGAGAIFFSHTLNRRVPPDPAMRRLSLVEALYQRRRLGLLTLAWAAAAAALLLAALHGMAAFLLFAAAFAGTALYRSLRERQMVLFRRRRSVFMLRNWAMAFGWSATLAGPAALMGHSAAEGLGAGLFVFLVCLGGTLVRDLHDIASDSLLGIDTMAAALGPVKARRLAGAAFLIAAALPFAACLAVLGQIGLSPLWSCFVTACAAAPALGLFLLHLMRKGRLRDAVALQFAVDAMGLSAGAFALAAAALSGMTL